MSDNLQPIIDRARLNALLTDIRDLIENSGASEVYFIVAQPQIGGGVKIVCADTGSTRYGAQAVETLYTYIKSKT